jgi:hypothetical protein
MKRAIKRTGAVLAALGCIVFTIQPAEAHSASASYYYPGGDRLEANVWIQTFSDWSGCGSWSTSAKLWGMNPALASWIKNTASFHANGWGASLSGVGVSGSGADASASWTNYNAWISDLSGTICGNWLTWYISAASTAVSYVPQYGSPRIVVAQV